MENLKKAQEIFKAKMKNLGINQDSFVDFLFSEKREFEENKEKENHKRKISIRN